MAVLLNHAVLLHLIGFSKVIFIVKKQLPEGQKLIKLCIYNKLYDHVSHKIYYTCTRSYLGVLHLLWYVAILHLN